MTGNKALHERKPVVLLANYLLALALPGVATYFTFHVSWLMGVPFALTLVAVAIVGWIGRIGPTVLTVLLGAVLFNYYLSPPLGDWSTAPPDLARTATVLCVGAFIGLLTAWLRRTQGELAGLGEQYRTTLSSIGDGVIVTDLGGKVTFLNGAAERLTGWPKAEAEGRPLEEVFVIVGESDGLPVESPVGRVRQLGTVVGFAGHTVLIRRDGTRLNIDDSGAPIYDSGKTVRRGSAEPQSGMTGVVLVFRDVTSKRLAERALEDRAAALTAAQEASNGAAWVLDLRARSTRWFPGGREIFGRPFAEFDDGTSPMHLVYWEDHPAVHEAERRVRELGEEFRVEFRVLWPNGELHWLEARGKADPSDENILYGVTLDVTRRKKAEAALLRAEKLSAVGSLASTIAHEVNNPLAAVVNLLYLALADGSLRPETRRLLETADEEIARLAGITRLTLTFARETPGAVTAVVAESVDAVLSLVKRKIEAREIRVEQRTDPAIVAAIKPHELRQVLLNIILNAIDAIHGTQGLLRVTTTADTSEVLIQIEDNGDGIAPGQLETIFNPFYSTKPDVGTGIGLWVSRELVQRHGGKITAASGELGDGARTRFEVRLPRS